MHTYRTGDIFSALGAQLASGFFDHIGREAGYAANNFGDFPAVLPMGLLTSAWHRGLLKRDDFAAWSTMLGCKGAESFAVADSAGRNRMAREWAWGVATEIERPIHPLGDYKRWLYLNTITQDQYDQFSQRHGFPRKYDDGIDRNNNHLQYRLFLDDYESLHVPELWQLYWRDQIDEETLRHHFTNSGYWRKQEQDYLIELSKLIPGPADLVRFAVRHIFEPTLTERFGFNDEMPADFIDWHSKQGFGYDFEITDPLDGTKHTTNWAKAFWQAHWVWPAPTQLYAMYQRLRPTGGEGGGPRIRGVDPFTREDLYLGLRGNDYPPVFRDRLAAIAFRPPTREDAYLGYQHGTINRTELVERHLDVGYNSDDSEYLAEIADARIEYQGIERILQRLGMQLRSAYQRGIVSREVAAVGLLLSRAVGLKQVHAWLDMTPAQRLNAADHDPAIQSVLELAELVGWERQWSHQQEVAARGKLKTAIVDLYKLGSLPKNEATGRLTAIGMTAAAADQVLAAADLESLKGQLSGAIQCVHRAYRSGEIDAEEARKRLDGLHITPERAADTVFYWTCKLSDKVKRFTAEQIVAWVCDGYMSVPDALGRLRNLGWKDPDNVLWFARVEACISKKAATAKRESDAAAAKASADAHRLLREMERAKEKAIADLRKATPLGSLKRWTKDGRISIDELKIRLRELTYPENVVSLIAEEVCSDPKATCYQHPTSKVLATEPETPPPGRHGL